MKAVRSIALSIACAAAAACSGAFLPAAQGWGQTADAMERAPEENFPAGSPAAINGALHVCGTKLCNKHGKPIQLRGMSSNGLQWFANCINDKSLDALAGDWKADVIRAAMYVQEGGYETNPEKFTKLVNRIVDQASERGLYVIVDWHILTPGDPFYNLERAKTFFTKVASRNTFKTNVIYEVANEPNGVSWDRIMKYHEEIIPVIRKQDPDPVILLGTRQYSSLGVSDGSGPQEIVDNPVRAKNVMYTFHFYAASFGAPYLNALDEGAKKLPIFVSEFGTQEYTSDGPNDFARAQKYLDIMEKHQIGWTNYNYADDKLSASVFKPGTCPAGKFSGTSRLKESGKWVRERIRSPDDFPKD